MSLTQEFVVFWDRYPRKIGKLAAQKAYERARKRGVTQDQILAGVERYVQHKPDYADWCHATTWLNQGRYDDEYGQRSGQDRRQQDRGEDRRLYPEWWEECQHLHGGACNGRAGHMVQMQLDEGRRKRAAGEAV